MQDELSKDEALRGTRFEGKQLKKDIIINGNMAFEELYAKYSAKNKLTVSLSDQEYQDVFALIGLTRGIGCEWAQGVQMV